MWNGSSNCSLSEKSVLSERNAPTSGNIHQLSVVAPCVPSSTPSHSYRCRSSRKSASERAFITKCRDRLPSANTSEGQSNPPAARQNVCGPCAMSAVGQPCSLSRRQKLGASTEAIIIVRGRAPTSRDGAGFDLPCRSSDPAQVRNGHPRSQPCIAQGAPTRAFDGDVPSSCWDLMPEPRPHREPLSDSLKAGGSRPHGCLAK